MMRPSAIRTSLSAAGAWEPQQAAISHKSGMNSCWDTIRASRDTKPAATELGGPNRGSRTF